MAEAPKGPGGKKHGPLTTGGWIAVGGGVAVLYFLYRRYQANAAANAATAAAPTTAEPISVGGGSGASTNGTGAGFSTMQGWVQAMLAQIAGANPNYNPGQAYNDVTGWINGGCVSAQGFGAISGAIGTVGLPPGFDPGPLSVCPSSTPAPTQVTPPAANPSEGAALPHLDWQDFAKFVNANPGGDLGQYTEVGTIQNGAASATVLNGAPVYALEGTGFGAILEQGFNAKSLPNGTKLYVPTSLVQKGYAPGVTA